MYVWKYWWGKNDKENNLKSDEDRTQHAREDKSDNKEETISYDENITQHERERENVKMTRID